MQSRQRQLIAGNWKMHGLTAAVSEARALADALRRAPATARVALCPPATLIGLMAKTVSGSDVQVGGQDCHPEAFGAFTGDISAEMLADAGAALVILGHSERRTYHGETDDMVAQKARAALRAGLEPIICVGETAEERRAGLTPEVVARQVRGSLPEDLRGRPFSVAYEPIWAIGTGLTPTLAQIEEVHLAIRGLLAERLGDSGASAPILYGGSVKPSNAAEILAAAEVGGALVGGASLKCEDFTAIVRAAPGATAKVAI
jgi:triosephosphate isomerase (TIM)